jgi:hypothetical protein
MLLLSYSELIKSYVPDSPIVSTTYSRIARPNDVRPLRMLARLTQVPRLIDEFLSPG